MTHNEKNAGPKDAGLKDTGMRRRDFLRKAGLGAGAAGAALAAGTVEAVAEMSGQTAPAADGYRETGHVRRYYATARS